MIRIGVSALDEIDAMVLEAIEACLEREVGAETRRLAVRFDTRPAYNEGRGQYSAPAMLKMLLDSKAAGRDERVLGVTRQDLYIPMLSFVFGQAQLDGRAAVISLARLDPRFYGLPPGGAVLAARAAKEALHETGHTLGLLHCGDARCVMAVSASLRQLDDKQAALCGACASKVRGKQPAGRRYR
jgi:archaemetzincin